MQNPEYGIDKNDENNADHAEYAKAGVGRVEIMDIQFRLKYGPSKNQREHENY